MLRMIRFLPARWWSPRAWRAWRSYLHWRLETYGAYDPDGRLNRKALRSMLKQMPAYHHWLGDFDRQRRRPLSSH